MQPQIAQVQTGPAPSALDRKHRFARYFTIDGGPCARLLFYRTNPAASHRSIGSQYNISIGTEVVETPGATMYPSYDITCANNYTSANNSHFREQLNDRQLGKLQVAC